MSSNAFSGSRTSGVDRISCRSPLPPPNRGELRLVVELLNFAETLRDDERGLKAGRGFGIAFGPRCEGRRGAVEEIEVERDWGSEGRGVEGVKRGGHISRDRSG